MSFSQDTREGADDYLDYLLDQYLLPEGASTFLNREVFEFT